MNDIVITEGGGHLVWNYCIFTKKIFLLFLLLGKMKAINKINPTPLIMAKTPLIFGYFGYNRVNAT